MSTITTVEVERNIAPFQVRIGVHDLWVPGAVASGHLPDVTHFGSVLLTTEQAKELRDRLDRVLSELAGDNQTAP